MNKQAMMLMLGVAMGCATSTTDSSTLGLLPAEAAGMSNLMLDESAAAYPLPATDVRLGASATPIDLEFFGNVAVAWRATDTAPGVRTRYDVVALWRVLERIPTSGVVDNGSQRDESTLNGSGDESASEALELVPAEFGDVNITEGVPRLDGDLLLIDFVNRAALPEVYDLALWEELRLFHQLCI